MLKSKPFRLLCLLCSSILFFAGFGLNSFAANNLINPNILEWENVTTDTSITGQSLMYVHKEGTVSKPIYRLQPTIYGEGEVNGQPTTTYSGWTLAPSMLRVGDNYTFRIHIPSPEEIRAVTDYTHSDQYFANWLGGVGFYICFGGFAADDSLTRVVEFVCINKDNYLSYAGRDLVYSFECPDFNVSDPGIYIFTVDITPWSPSVFFLDGSISLVNDSAADEEGFFDNLGDLITGFFHDLKWDLIGGACGDSDCYKTPHTSLSGRICDSLSSLGDLIKGFFHDLKWEIVGGVCESDSCNKSPHQSLGDRITNRLDEVKKGIQDRIDNIETWLTNLKDGLLKGIKDLFVPDQAFLNNFKTNVSKIFSDSLGFAYDISTFVGDVFDKLISILGTNASGTFSFTFPGLDFVFLGYHIKLWDDITLSFAFLNTIPGFSLMYSLYKVSLHGMCIFLLAGYGLKIYDGVVDSK